MRERRSIFLVPLLQQLAGMAEALLHLWQAIGDGLLQDAARVLVFFKRALQAGNLGFQIVDGAVAPVEFDLLAGGLLACVFDPAFKLMNANCVLGAQPVLVCAYLRLGHRQMALYFGNRQTLGTAAIERQ